MRLHDIVTASRSIGETSGRSEKVRQLAECLRHAQSDEIEIAVGLLSGEARQGRIGIGPAALHAAASTPPAPAPTLTLDDVDRALDRIAATLGAGSSAERARLTRELLSHATADEQNFLLRALMGELRQGAVEGLMVEAVAKAAELPLEEIRRALMVTGKLGAVAKAALTGGRAELAGMSIQLFRPLAPMLAQTAESVGEALAHLGEAAFEYKLDGARIQVHKRDEEVRIYTRSLKDVTPAAPEIVEAVQGLKASTLILDGEAIGFQQDGRPQPFQITMRRFGRKLDVPRLRQEIPLRAFFFDCLYLDDHPLIDRPGSERYQAHADAIPEPLRVRRRVTRDRSEAEIFLQEALGAGHEGVMAKALDAPYEAGARGRGWLKIKPIVTLDLVVLAVERGNGRRSRWLSNLHLGARDPATGGFVMLGKTFKGMTDEMLAWQSDELRKLAVSDDGYTVQVEPKLVVEIAFNDIQASPRYPGGLALRFARVKGYRPDKRAEEADTIDTVRALYVRRQSGA
jgi:ATP-dependent DNA ligase I